MAPHWRQIGPPLRPAHQDLQVLEHYVFDGEPPPTLPRVLLLGVTPEIYDLLKDRSFLLAVDNSPSMIEHVWRGGSEDVLCADWRNLPLPSHSRDVALCDAGLHLLEYPADQRILVDRLHEVLKPGGHCILRLFVPPAMRETPEQVLTDLFRRRIRNLNVLKLRLGMALQRSASAGAAVHDIWDVLRRSAKSWEHLATHLGWSLEHLQVIEAYHGSAARYHFVSAEEAAELFVSQGKFVEVARHFPTYDLGQLCPTVVFKRR
jgi:SAM-dependent methyltransferase